MSEGKSEGKMEKIVSLAKRRGFIFQGSEIYGGLAGTWDYGPLGVALKNNIKQLWWKQFVLDREDMYGLDAAILMNPKTWEASGHVGGFSDPLVECEKCNSRFRTDVLIDDYDKDKFIRFQSALIGFARQHADKAGSKLNEVSSLVDYHKILTDDLNKDLNNKDFEISINVLRDKIVGMFKEIETDNKISNKTVDIVEKSKKFHGLLTDQFLNWYVDCPNCKKREWNESRNFNMMFKTNVGAAEDASSISYLRPETAQGIFVNFKNILDSMHPKLPFGIAQIGKAFRNEIAPRDFIFRTREFEQMEIEYFVHPEDWEIYFEQFVKELRRFLESIGLNSEKIHELEIAPEDRAHYSKRTIDFEFDYPFGKKELLGLAYRTDFDLKAHIESSKQKLDYLDEENGEKIVPHVIEPSFGVDRLVLALLSDAYTEDEMNGEVRTYLKLSANVAPVKVAVFPLLKNKPELVEKAREIYQKIKKVIPQTAFDDNGNVGKRYRRQDEIGTPFCITVDFETLEKGTGVTVRDRDTGEQERVSEDQIVDYLRERF